MKQTPLVLLALALVGCPPQSKEEASKEKGEGNEKSSSLAWDPNEQGSQSVIPVKVQAVERGRYSEYSEFFAEVDALRKIDLKATAGGTVSRLLAEEGDRVKAGKSLCEIDAREALNNEKIARIEERLAKETLDRNKSHAGSGTISKVQLDRSELAYLQAKNARIRAEKVSQSALCRAPFAGTVIKRHIEQHAELPPGAPTFEFADLRKVKITIGIPESDLMVYQKGTKVSISVDGLAGKSWSGEIERVGETVDQRDRTIAVEVHIENPDRTLKPGLTVRARVQKYNLENVIVLPNEAILTFGKTRVVMIADGEVARKRAVTVRSTNETVSLIAEGVEEGEPVIMRGQSVVVDGSPIQKL